MSRAQGWRRLALFVGGCALVAVALATLAAAFAGTAWIGELAVHFRAQYVALALASAAALGVGGRVSLAVVAACLALFNGGLFYRSLDGGVHVRGGMVATATAAAASEPGGQRLRVAAVNVFFGNSNHDAVLQWLRAERPDVVVVSEVTPDWFGAFEALSDEYPFRYAGAATGGFRTILLSKFAHVAQPIDARPGAGRILEANFRIGTAPLTVLGVHATWPATPDMAAQRNREFAHLAARALRSPAPVILLGDLNVSPLSPHFSEGLLAAGDLRPASAGMWQPTWPAMFLPLGIQIDHVLVSPEIRVRAFRRGPWVGSDHRPIVADLEWMPATDEPPAAGQVQPGRDQPKNSNHGSMPP
jgi:endonuclease/exonuclease/phosphatase (EEP) superfamily protein YafD